MNGDDDPRAGNEDDELKAEEAPTEGAGEQNGGAELEGEDWVEELERGRGRAGDRRRSRRTARRRRRSRRKRRSASGASSR